MNKVRCIKPTLAAALLLPSCMAACCAASADSPAPPREYRRVTKNKQYVFAMLAPRPFDRFGVLQKKYPKSGLYRNNGSRTPLWTVDWFAQDVDVSDDGHHAVRWGPWPGSGDQYQTLTLAFYNNGRLFKWYKVKDLIANPRYLPSTISHYIWSGGKYFDGRRNRVTVMTLKGALQKMGKRYTFDVTTGNVVGGKLPTR